MILVHCYIWYCGSMKFPDFLFPLNCRNNKWKFLEGVKVSGAPPPRTVIVQQCIRDMGVLEVLCNYVSVWSTLHEYFGQTSCCRCHLNDFLVQASPTKKFLPSRPTINFCTAVVVEALGSVSTVDSDAVKRILPFVVSGLQPGTKGGSDHKVRFNNCYSNLDILIITSVWHNGSWMMMLTGSHKI